MTKIPKILKVLFSFNLRWIALFFKILKALHKYELKNLTAKISVPMVIVLRKLVIFDFSLVFKYILVFYK